MESAHPFLEYEIRLTIRRSEREPHRVQSSRNIYEFMRGIEGESAEHLYEVLLDAKRSVHGVYLVGKGGLDNCLADPREVFKAALITNSPSFVLVHNHPSGIPNPSPEDIALAKRIAAGAEILGLTFLDSVIIGDGRYYSFLEAGLMAAGRW